MVKALENLKDFQEHVNSGKVIIIDFWATWCGPCRVISPVFEKFETEFGADNIVFVKVDVDNATDIAQEVGIRAMPTFQVYKDGHKIKELIGANPGALKTLVEESKSLV